MPNRPPKRPLPPSSDEPDAAFNWPPSDAVLAQYGMKIPGLPVADPVMPPETLAQSSAPDVEQAAPPPSFFAPQYAEVEAPMGDEGEIRPGVEDSSIPGVAVAQREYAVDADSPGEWAAEIARLQELMDGLTQKLEWRIERAGR